MAKDAVHNGRIIPADAGSTSSKNSLVLVERDHPRGCGEHLALVIGGRHSQRIIPADAGSTAMGSAAQSASGDHPRGCGEHT